MTGEVRFAGKPAAAILVGGGSRRMGCDKARLVLAGRTLLDHVAERVAPLASRILIVGGVVDPHAPGRHLPDAVTGQGPLGGIVAALEGCGAEWCFVLACDCPLVAPALLERLVRAAGPGYDAVVPRHAGGAEPLLALYRTSAAAPVARVLLRDGIRAAHALPERLATRWIEEPELRRVDPTLRSFTNLNRPEDVKACARTLPEAPQTSPP